MRRIRLVIVRVSISATLVLSCSSETEVTDEVEAPAPLAEAPAPGAPDTGDGADETGVLADAEAAALPQTGAPPAAGDGGAVNRDDVPWVPDGALIEVRDISDEENPDADMVRTVFEVPTTPDIALERYKAELEKAGYSVEPFGDDMLLATKADTLVTTIVWPETGKTRVEIFVSARPEGL